MGCVVQTGRTHGSSVYARRFDFRTKRVSDRRAFCPGGQSDRRFFQETRQFDRPSAEFPGAAQDRTEAHDREETERERAGPIAGRVSGRAAGSTGPHAHTYAPAADAHARAVGGAFGSRRSSLQEVAARPALRNPGAQQAGICHEPLRAQSWLCRCPRLSCRDGSERSVHRQDIPDSVACHQFRWRNANHDASRRLQL